MIWSDLKYRIRALFRREVMDRELADELRFHLERETEKHVRAGLSRAEARRRARIEFGGEEQIAEATRSARGLAALDAVLQDVRYAWRGVVSRPGFALAVVLTLGLGIAANAAMFSVVDRLLLRPPAYLEAPERVHRVYMDYLWNGAERSDRHFAYRTYDNVRRYARTLDATAAFVYSTQAVGRGAAVRELPVAVVSPSLFDFFQARPALGRFFDTRDDVAPAGAPVALLGYGHWQSEYGGRRDVIGEQLHVGSVTYTIIGVAPRGFVATKAGEAPAAFVPLTYDHARSAEDEQEYGWSWLEILVRRKPGVPLSAATADVSAALVRGWEEGRAMRGGSFPSAAEARVTGRLYPVQPARGPDAGPDAKVAAWVLGVAGIVLLIAAANVVNLLLARAVHRRREIALRMALGVSRLRLAQQLLVETLLLAVLGGAAGLLLTRFGGGTLTALFLGGADVAPDSTDARTLLFTAVLTLALALLTGLAPALQTVRADVANTIKAGMTSSTYRTSVLRTSLLVIQGALCVVLLVGAGLFVRSLSNVRSLRLGYDADALVFAAASLRGLELSEAQQNELSERLLAASVPFEDWQVRGAPHVPGRDSLELLGGYTLQTGSADYFATTGTRILRGRGFLPSDVPGALPVIVLSRSMAAAIWPGEDPIGKTLHFGRPPYQTPELTVVGVAEDVVSEQLGGRGDFWYYVPFAQYRAMYGEGPMRRLFIRVQRRPDDQVEALRARLQRELPGDAFVRVAPFSMLLEPQQRSWRVGATMFVTFAALALVLAAIGLYSVVAYAVAQRTRELGVRVALGAKAGSIMLTVARETALFAAIGMGAGGVIALLAGRWIEPLLFDTSPRDPLVYGSVAAVLLFVAVAATLRPALRAARVDPTIALRAE